MATWREIDPACAYITKCPVCDGTGNKDGEKCRFCGGDKVFIGIEGLPDGIR